MSVRKTPTFVPQRRESNVEVRRSEPKPVPQRREPNVERILVEPDPVPIRRLNAQDDIAKGHRNAAIGALLNNQELIHNLKTLHEAIFLIHRNADAFENQGEPHDQ